MRFLTLSADLQSQDDQNQATARMLQTEQHWLEQQGDLPQLYQRISEIELLLTNYAKLSTDRLRLQQTQQAETALTPRLASELAQAQNACLAAQTAVDNKQKDIDQTTLRRNQLDPDAINQALDEVNSRLNLIDKWKERLAALRQQLDNIAQSEHTLEQQKKELAEAQAQAQNKKELFDLATVKHETYKEIFS